VLQLFKMALPSMIQESTLNSVQGKKSSNMIDDWPVLSAYQCSKIKSLPSAIKQAPSAMNSRKRQGFQNSKDPCYGKTNGPACPTQNQGPKAKPIMIQNGSKRGWFYPSKGLSELFYQAGKIAMMDLKGALSTHPNPKPIPPNSTPGNSQRRRSYVEVLTMEFSGDNGRRLDAGRGMDGSRVDDKEKSAMAGRGVGGGGSTEGRTFNHAGRFNPGHERGRAYGRYARGWQGRPYIGYRYSRSRFNGSVG
jgi:hypothetical protein